MSARDVLDQIRQRAENATNGPWRHLVGLGEARVENGHVSIGREHATRDAEFIAAARSDVPRLVAALTAVLDLAGDPGGPDWWSHKFISVITDALTPKESNS